MKFKRVLAMAVTAVMTCSLLAGCGGKTESAGTVDSGQVRRRRILRRQIQRAVKRQTLNSISGVMKKTIFPR